MVQITVHRPWGLVAARRRLGRPDRPRIIIIGDGGFSRRGRDGSSERKGARERAKRTRQTKEGTITTGTDTPHKSGKQVDTGGELKFMQRNRLNKQTASRWHEAVNISPTIRVSVAIKKLQTILFIPAPDATLCLLAILTKSASDAMEAATTRQPSAERFVPSLPRSKIEVQPSGHTISRAPNSHACEGGGGF